MAPSFKLALIRWVSVGISLALAQEGAPWPSLGFNAQRTSFNPYYGPASSTVQHAAAFLGVDPILYAPLIDANGWSYIATKNGTVYALSGSSTTPVWQATFTGSIGTMTLANGSLFVPATGLYALEAATGEIVWTYRPSTNFTSTIQQYSIPLQTDLIVATAGKTVHAVGATSGQLVWSALVPGTASPVAVAPGGTVYVTWQPTDTSSPQGISAINAADGSPLWTTRGLTGCAAEIAPPAMDSKGIVYAVFPCDGMIVSFAPTTGVPTWNASVNASRTLSSFAISSENQIYVAGHEYILCFDAGTSEPIWEGGPGEARFVASGDGRLYATANGNTVYAISAALGRVAWSLSLGADAQCSEPVPGVGGQLLFACMDGQTYAITSIAAPAPWPQKGHDAGKSGQTSLLGPKGPNVVAVQTLTTNGVVISSPAISNTNDVFIGSTDGNLYKLHGTAQSVCFTAGGPIWSAPSVSQSGFVYFTSDDGNLYALNATDCSFVWNFTTPARVRTSPLVGVLDDVVYLLSNTSSSSQGAYVYALDGRTGDTLWSYQLNYYYYGADALVFADGVLMLPAAPVLLFNPVTGTIIDSPIRVDAPAVAAVATGGQLYGSMQYNGIQSWDITTQEQILNLGAYQFYRFAVASDAAGNVTMYGTTGQNIRALNTWSGETAWSFATNGTILSTPVVDGAGHVYVGSNDGNVYALDGSSGALLWVFETQGSVESSPAIGADGTLYIGSNDGNMYVLQDAS
jgi:outer membrane protein assembly factor BamB